jgi:RHS repeat-associated protein
LMTNAAGTIVPHGDHAVMGFPGQYANAKQLAGAQYYYNRYRDYNDATGRYILADPIGLAGGSNPFSYAMNNALRYMDPIGLAQVCNHLSRPILVGGSTGFGHGHEADRSKDKWAGTTLEPGQCVSAWEPRRVRLPSGKDCWLTDIDAIDANGDGRVKWPGTSLFPKVTKYLDYRPLGESVSGSGTGGGFWSERPNRFVVVRDGLFGNPWLRQQSLGRDPVMRPRR